MEINSPNVKNCVDYINMTCIKLKRNCVLPLYKCFTALKASFKQWHELDLLPVSCLTEVLSVPVLPSQLCLHAGLEKHFVTYTKKKK